MAASFPASYDALTNPTSGSLLTSPSHATQHINANDVVEAIEQRVGLSGSSFPGSPSSGQFFHHTTRRMDYFYNGTRWLSTELSCLPIPWRSDASISATTTGSHQVMVPHAGTYDLWLENFQASFYVTGGTALSGSHNWQVDLEKHGGGVLTNISLVDIDSGFSDTWRDTGLVSIGSLLGVGTPYLTFLVNSIKTGTPGSLQLNPMIYYRVVG